MNTRIFTLDPKKVTPAAVREAAGLLAAGQVVAFPTETVYGLGVRADRSEAVERLNALKGRPPEKPYAVHLPRAEEAATHSPHPGRAARRLMERYWPGPLTLVVPAAAGGQVGLRLPANRIAAALLDQAGGPVVATSANRHGQPPLCEGGAVAEEFDGELPAVLDGGRTELCQASSVVEARGPVWTLKREGIITLDMVQKTANTRLLFVCTGNSCRSPLAAGLLKRLLADNYDLPADRLDEHGFEVASAGVSSVNGGPASAGAITAGAELGADLSGHRTRLVSAEMIRKAHQVFVMSKHQMSILRREYPEAKDKLRHLDRRQQDIQDPIGGTKEQYLECARKIKQLLTTLVRNL